MRGRHVFTWPGTACWVFCSHTFSPYKEITPWRHLNLICQWSYYSFRCKTMHRLRSMEIRWILFPLYMSTVYYSQMKMISQCDDVIDGNMTQYSWTCNWIMSQVWPLTVDRWRLYYSYVRRQSDTSENAWNALVYIQETNEKHLQTVKFIIIIFIYLKPKH